MQEVNFKGILRRLKLKYTLAPEHMFEWFGCFVQFEQSCWQFESNVQDYLPLEPFCYKPVSLAATTILMDKYY